jgi:ABC-type transport system involved in multi-copper enzyme maturation permease subunit
MRSFFIAKNEIQHLFRERTFFLILTVFILISLASTYIGWASQHTVESVYQESVITLESIGKTAPPSTFSNLPPLEIVKNMIIYVVLIGSLLAITVGHSIGTKDQRAGVVRILFSKPLTKKEFLLGKALSLGLVLLAVLTVSLIISTVSVSILSQLSFVLLLQLIEFYAVSYFYMLGFGFLGLGFGLMKRNSAIALLTPIIIWVIITFALPEMSSALYPTSSLNPVLPQTEILNSPVLSAIHNIFYPFSVSEHYRVLSYGILNLQETAGTIYSNYSPMICAFILAAWVIITYGVLTYSMSKFEISRGDMYE